MIDVTVIVPIYNVEKYLEKCLDSLVEQDYDKEKIEILAVEDGSTDQSKEILKQYVEKYSFITPKYLEKNQGVSYARNLGIKEAKGNFIIFCDSDDYYERDTISKFMKVANEKNADFVMANYYISYENKDIKVDISNYFAKDIITKQEIISYMTLTSCSKMIKKSIFIDNNIYYPEDIKRCEELTVIPVLAYLAEKPIFMNEALYHYYQRKASASNSNKGKGIEEFDFFDITFERFIEYIDQKKYQQEIEFKAIEQLLYGKLLVMLKARISKKELVDEIGKFKRKYPNFLKNPYLKRYSKAKVIFIKLFNYKMIFLAMIYAKLHEKLTV